MIKSWATVGCMLCIGKTTSRSLHCFYFDRHSYSFLLQKIADSGYMYPLCWKGKKVEYDISSLHNVLLENQFMYIHLMWNKTAPSFIGGEYIIMNYILNLTVENNLLLWCLISLWFWIWLDRPRKLSSYPVHHIPYYYSTLFSSHKGFAPLFL